VEQVQESIRRVAKQEELQLQKDTIVVFAKVAKVAEHDAKAEERCQI